MKRFALALGCLLASVSLFAQDSACLPVSGTVDDVIYAADNHPAHLFPAFTLLHLHSTDPDVRAFRVTVELKTGQLAPANAGQSNPQPFVVSASAGAPDVLFVASWCQVARVTVESLKTVSVHQIRLNDR